MRRLAAFEFSLLVPKFASNFSLLNFSNHVLSKWSKDREREDKRKEDVRKRNVFLKKT